MIFLGPKGRKHTEEEKQKMRGRVVSVETREIISKRHKGVPLSEEHKRKISNGLIGNTNARGFKHTEETKQKVSFSLLGSKNPRYGKRGKDNPRYGQKHTEESKQKMREALKGRVPWNKGKTCPQLSESTKGKNNGMYGKKHSEETRTKISNALNLEETKRKLRLARSKQILPQKDTSIEIIMQNALIKHEVPFETHVSLLGKYQADIKIGNLIVECDGDYWHTLPDRVESDRMRDIDLNEAGYNILRFWGSEIRDDVSQCVSQIENYLNGGVR